MSREAGASHSANQFSLCTLQPQSWKTTFALPGSTLILCWALERTLGWGADSLVVVRIMKETWRGSLSSGLMAYALKTLSFIPSRLLGWHPNSSQDVCRKWWQAVSYSTRKIKLRQKSFLISHPSSHRNSYPVHPGGLSESGWQQWTDQEGPRAQWGKRHRVGGGESHRVVSQGSRAFLRSSLRWCLIVYEIAMQTRQVCDSIGTVH